MSSSTESLDHLKIPLEDILEATNNFSSENFIRQGGFGKIYKGTLLWSGKFIDIVARRLDTKYGQGSKQFWTEILMLSKLKHENLVSLVGFCDEKNEKIVINKYEAKGSLDNYITDPTFTWGRRLYTCAKIAHALSYIHYDEKRDFSVIHRNIKSSKILLGDFWVPKLSGFELSMTTVASQRDRLCIKDACGSTGYFDPTYAKTGTVTHKSDIYSFGVVLFEVLFGMKAITDNRDIQLAKEAKSRYENEQLDDVINPDLRKQMAGESLKIFSKTAYDCLKEHRLGRPTIDQVVKKLEAALKAQRLQASKVIESKNPLHLQRLKGELIIDVRAFEGTSSDLKGEHLISGLSFVSNRDKQKSNTMSSPIQDLDYLIIPLKDILKATNHFSNKNFIRQGGFGKIYKGKLLRSGELIDIVARRLDGKYDQGSKEFWTEVSMLSRLKHTNLVSLVGFCDEKNEKIVINKYEAKGSLDHYVTDLTLRWMKRLEICVKIAHALSYIHYDVGRDFSVIHRNIKTSKILLDDNYEPKLAGFEFSMTTVESRRGRLCIDDACGSVGYVDPTYVETGTVTHKSDIYAFGVILFEVLFGMKAITNNRDIKLANLARSGYENEQLDDSINPDLRTQMAGESLKIFSDTAYDCLKEHRVGRPNIHTVVMKLEKALEIQRLQENKALKAKKKAYIHQKHIIAGKRRPFRKSLGFIEELSDHRWIKANETYLFEKRFGENPILDIRAFEGTSSDWKAQNLRRWETDDFEDRYLQESQEQMNNLQISLADIKLATQDFRDDNLIGEGGFGKVYRGKLLCAGRHKLIAAKRLDRTSNQGETELMTELVILSEYKHMNVIDLVSYCNEKGEKVIVYDYASKGSLDRWLKRKELTWRKRLEICIDIARGLDFLHGTSDVKQEVVIHRDIKSANILLHDDWKASINDFGLSLISPINQNINFVIDNAKGTRGYCDPQYITTGALTKESDIYSFGVLLFEMLCGRFVMEHNSSIVDLVRQHFEKGTLYEMVFEATKKQMAPPSLTKFQNIAYQCIHEERSKRPTASDVLIQLKRALKIQEKWEDLKISLDDIMLDTRDFSHDYLIGKGDSWSLYKGRVKCADGCEMIAAKRLDRRSDQRETELMAEHEILLVYTHENIISLVGYCNEKGEKVMVYEFASISKGSLDRWLKYDGLTWRKRLEICIDIARGLAFLHGTSREKHEVVIHGDIKCENVLLNDDWKAKIADFGQSLIRPGYCDPLYPTTEVLTKESDIYSLGVLLFEMLCGRFVMEHHSSRAHNLVHLVRDHFEEGTLYEIVLEPTRKQLAPRSLTTFANIAYQCLHEEGSKRPTANDVLIQLKKSLELQEKIEEKIEHLNISLDNIMLATQDFSLDNLIGKGGSGPLYKGQATCAHGCEIIAAKRLDRMSDQRETERITELEVLSEYKHENIIALFGLCNEKQENIIVYEYASKGSLDRWLKYDGLTWMKRLEICIDIARGLTFLHGTSGAKQEVVIHRDIKSKNVLLDNDWKAKISDFGCSLISPINQELKYVVNNPKGKPGYCDPLYTTTGVLTKESDIYSLGVLLFEMLCGRSVMEHNSSSSHNFIHFVRDHFEKGTLYEIVFEATKKELLPNSLTAFQNIAYQCVHEEREKRPTAEDVVTQLKKALEIQEDTEIWKPKLLRDYKRFIQMTDSPEICYGMNYKDLYTWLHERFLHREHKVFFSFGANGGRVEMISATEFQCKSFFQRNKCRKLSESRFGEVVQISDSSSMNIQISVKTQLLSPGVVYGVYLVYKFCRPIDESTTRTHKLAIKMGSEDLFPELTTRRDNDGWMRIELHRFSNLKEEANFDAFLMGFSDTFKNEAIYVEGVEFRPISNMTREEIEELEKASITNGGWSIHQDEDDGVPFWVGVILSILCCPCITGLTGWAIFEVCKNSE